jgi:IclR family acetate operon transcriptional repressor
MIKTSVSNPAGRVAKGEKKTGSRALAKGLRLLEELAVVRQPMTLGQLAKCIELGKASTFRLLQTLASTGYVVQHADQHYGLNRIWTPALTQDWLRSLVEVARPHMHRLNAESAETVSLAVLLEDHIRVAESIESPQHVRMSNYKGRILAPYASSLGKAIAAFQPPDRLQCLLNIYGIYPTTEKTLTDPVLIRQDMARTQERGYAVEYGETVHGGCCFGAPIFSGDDVVAASISVSFPTVRLTQEREVQIPRLLREAARQIAKQMKNHAASAETVKASAGS